MLGVLAVYFAAAAGMGGLELDLSGIEGLADAAPVALPPPPPLPPPEADECALWGGAVGGAAVAAGAGLYRCSYKRARCFGWHHSEAGFCNGYQRGRPYATMFTPREQHAVEVDSLQGTTAAFEWHGANQKCLAAWAAFICAYTFDKCEESGAAGEPSFYGDARLGGGAGVAADSCPELCAAFHEACDSVALLRTVRRYAAAHKFDKAARMARCANFQPNSCTFSKGENGGRGRLWEGIDGTAEL